MPWRRPPQFVRVPGVHDAACKPRPLAALLLTALCGFLFAAASLSGGAMATDTLTAADTPGLAATAATDRGGEMRIYVSLPRQGANAATSRLIVKGLEAALRERRARIGDHPVRLIHLNDAAGRRWKPGMVQDNALRAVADERAVAYVGELNSEATAIAQGILAPARMTMFAPVSTATALTDRLASGPTRPVLFRSMPTDAEQADALGFYLRREGVRRFALVEDGALYGQGLAGTVSAVARSHGVRLVAHRRANRNGKGSNALARSIARHSPQAVLFAGSLSSGAVALFRALNREMPKALLFGGDALAHNVFARRLGPIQSRVRLTAPAARVQPRRSRALGLGSRPDAVTVFAYEGMRALLGAIERSGAAAMVAGGGGDIRDIREAVRSAVFDRHVNRGGAIGHWRIESSGDSSIRTFSAIRLRGGQVLDRGRIVAHKQRR